MCNLQSKILSSCVALLRSTPVETLHTLLLGPYKYLLKDFIANLNSRQKSELQALVDSFELSGFDVKILGKICQYHKSFVGRDFKAWAQMAPFIVDHFLTSEEVHMWICLSKVHA